MEPRARRVRVLVAAAFASWLLVFASALIGGARAGWVAVGAQVGCLALVVTLAFQALSWSGRFTAWYVALYLAVGLLGGCLPTGPVSVFVDGVRHTLVRSLPCVLLVVWFFPLLAEKRRWFGRERETE